MLGDLVSKVLRRGPLSNLDLDPAFYRRYYEDLSHLTTAHAREHWNDHGKQEGRYPNAAAALDHLLSDPRLPPAFTIANYLKDNKDLAAKTRWPFEAVKHYLDHELAGGLDGGKDEALAAETHAMDGGDLAFNPDRLVDLPEDFNLATYLARNPDVRDSITAPEAALLHYLDYGRFEGRVASLETIDLVFVRSLYGVDVPTYLPAKKIASFIRLQLDVSFTDLVFHDEQEMLWNYQINNPLIARNFDPYFYRLNSFAETGSLVTREQLLLHFCEKGRFEASDISSRFSFDDDFYEDENSGEIAALRPLWLKLTDKDAQAVERRKILFQDWLSRVKDTTNWPNLHVWFASTYNFEVPETVVQQIRSRRAVLGPAIAPHLYLKQLLDSGTVDDILSISLTDDASGEFVTNVADSHGDKTIADMLYTRVALALPRQGRALRHRADQLQRAGFVGTAASLRADLIAGKTYNIWTFITQSQCLSQLGLDEAAADALWQGVNAFPGDAALRRRSRKLSTDNFQTLWDQSTSRALANGHAAAQDDIRRALRRCTSKQARPKRHQTIKRIAIYGNYDLPQCRFYRIDQKVEQLIAAGYEVAQFDYVHETDRFIRAIPTLDLVICYRVPAFPYVIDAIEKAGDFGLPTVFEVDDLIFEATAFPPDLDTYAGQISEEVHASLACGVPMFEHTLSLCDFAMSSTEAMRPFMEAKVREGVCYVHSNALSVLHLACLQEQDVGGDAVTIFYGSGTRAHKSDFHDLVAPALIEVLSKYENARVLIVGYMTLTPQLAALGERIQVLEPLTNLEDYWDLLRTADISLSVLSRSLFNDCKSEIKWLEASLAGIPSVVSRTATLEAVIEDGRTGFLCDTADDFARSLNRLVAEPALRVKMGSDARHATLAHYSKPIMAENLRRMVGDIEARLPPARPRLLIVNVFYPPQSIGGATRVVHDNVRDLSKTFDVTVVCTLEGGEVPYEIGWYAQDGVRVFQITTPDRPDIDKIIEDPRMGEAFARCLDMIRPELVHFHCVQRLTASAVDVVRRRGIPFIVTLHDGWWISPHQFLVDDCGQVAVYDYAERSTGEAEQLPARARILRRLLRSAACVTAVSEAFGDFCRKMGLTSVVAIENGVSRLPAITRMPATGRVRLGHFGGTELHKGLPLLKFVLETTPFRNLSLVVIDLAMSPDAQREEIWGTTPVILRGKVPQSQVAGLYAAIDVLVAPSIWPETFGLVTREAAALGCWIVGSDRGGIAGCVEEGRNGFIVEVDTPDGLGDALRTIDADPDRFMASPDFVYPVRLASTQAAELAALYERILANVEQKVD